jgi:hypothetical protein
MQEIIIVDKSLTRSELKQIAAGQFGDMVKAVVDIENNIMAIGGELHSDEEAKLLDHGSKQQNLWGINLYPQKSAADWIEFDSMINIRPSQNNRSRSVDDESIRKKIIDVVSHLVKE